MHARRVIVPAAAMLAIVAAGAATAYSAADLRGAKAAVTAAQRRAAALDARADRTADPAERARPPPASGAARVDAAEAEVTAGRVRRGLIDTLLTARRAALAQQQGPVAQLIATLTSLARRPAVATLTQPGSIDDLVHVQAVLSSTLPAVEARTAALRGELAQARALRASAGVAARELEAGRAGLMEARAQLAMLTDRDEGDDARALALGEAARDAVDRLAAVGGGQAVLGDLIALPGPPVARAAPAAAASPAAYRLPVGGRLVTGLGELSDNGVKARGLTFAVAPGAAVIAPAGGRIVFARPFRSYGGVVIIDHGDGWTTLLTGLGALAVRRGQAVAPGAAIGRAAVNDGAHVTVELRRQGVPMDIAQLVG